MKYYSEQLDKLFDDEKSLKEAETAREVELAAKAAKEDKLKKERKQRADEVDSAYKAMIDARNHYNDVLKAFLEDYHSYHKTYTSADGSNLVDFFKYAFTW